jgi:hypothetical protein
VREALELEQAIVQQTRDAYQAKGEEAERAASDIEGALAPVSTALRELTETLGQQINLKLEVDQSAVDGLVNTIEPLLNDKTFMVMIEAELDSFIGSIEEAGALARDNPVELAVTLVNVDGALRELQTRLEGRTDGAAVELQLKTGKALSAIAEVETRLQGITDTDSEHTIQTNADQARREIDALNGRNTRSEHIIYVTKRETNATGGLVGTLARFARGGLAGGPGWDVVPGAGNTDSVRADLPAGAFVLRKSATRYYGDLLRRLAATRFAVGGLVPSLLMPGERWFRPETVGRLGVGLFDALNRMAIPREHLAAAMAQASAPVARFAEGGLVGRATVPLGSGAMTAAARDTVDINLRLGARAVQLSGSRDQAAALASALRDLARGA